MSAWLGAALVLLLLLVFLTVYFIGRYVAFSSAASQGPSFFQEGIDFIHGTSLTAINDFYWQSTTAIPGFGVRALGNDAVFDFTTVKLPLLNPVSYFQPATSEAHTGWLNWKSRSGHNWSDANSLLLTDTNGEAFSLDGYSFSIISPTTSAARLFWADRAEGSWSTGKSMSITGRLNTSFFQVSPVAANLAVDENAIDNILDVYWPKADGSWAAGNTMRVLGYSDAQPLQADGQNLYVNLGSDQNGRVYRRAPNANSGFSASRYLSLTDISFFATPTVGSTAVAAQHSDASVDLFWASRASDAFDPENSVHLDNPGHGSARGPNFGHLGGFLLLELDTVTWRVWWPAQDGAWSASNVFDFGGVGLIQHHYSDRSLLVFGTSSTWVYWSAADGSWSSVLRLQIGPAQDLDADLRFVLSDDGRNLVYMDNSNNLFLYRFDKASGWLLSNRIVIAGTTGLSSFFFYNVYLLGINAPTSYPTSTPVFAVALSTNTLLVYAVTSTGWQASPLAITIDPSHFGRGGPLVMASDGLSIAINDPDAATATVYWRAPNQGWTNANKLVVLNGSAFLFGVRTRFLLVSVSTDPSGLFQALWSTDGSWSWANRVPIPTDGFRHSILTLASFNE